MDSVSGTAAETAVRYLLTPRLSSEGHVQITLKLYQGPHVVLAKPVATIERGQVADVMWKCHRHLAKLGLQGVSTDMFRPRGPSGAAASMPMASRLFQDSAGAGA